MGGEQISSEFEYSASFLKILMPGIIISTLASFLLILNYPQYISFFKELITKSVWAILPLGGIFLTVSIIVGLIVSILTNTLTMVLEGYYLEKYNKNFFVRPVRGFLHKRQWEMFDKYRSNYAYTYLFSWDKNPRKVNRKLMEFLKQSFGLDWVKTAKIEKIDDGMALRFFTEKNSLSLRIDDAKTKLNLIIDDGRTYEFIIKSENNKLNIYTKTEGVERELIYRDLYYYFSNCLYESYKDSNINKAILDEKLKKCILPTKLGNVYKSMEIYPVWKYGMDGVFFWTRIQLIMSEELKNTMDKMRALVDMCVDLTCIFFFAAIIYLLVLVYNENYIFSLVFFVLFLLFSLFSYNIAVQSALKFGVYVRSTFDLYREELWGKIKNGQFKKLNTLPEKERWDNVFKYLWFFNTIQCPKCGKFYESKKKHDCNRL